ncbi:MAG: type II toxin-antitoxin system VapC family toxin [Hyphomicrobiaceae bacterium]
MTIFVDSSVWFAAAVTKDRGNLRAKAILREADELLTSDHVLIETWLLLRSRSGRHAAEQFWDGLRRGAARLETVSPSDLDAAWRIGEAFRDQDFSLVDRTSFALMERLGITTAASFDNDFAVYRYGRARDNAFHVLR